MTTPRPASVRFRASDADRQEALSRLGDHFADGRLDRDEFDLRSTQALHAVHQDELDGLFGDLPAQPGPVRPPVPPARRRPRLPLGVVLTLLLAAAALVLVSRGFAVWPLLALWWFTGGPCGGARPRPPQRRGAGQPG